MSPSEAFWNWLGMGPATAFMASLGLVVMLFLVFQRRRNVVDQAGEDQAVGGGRFAANSHDSSRMWWMLFPVILVAATMLPVLLLKPFRAAPRSVPTTAPQPTAPKTVGEAVDAPHAARPLIEDWNWKWTSDGPRGTKEIVNQLSLSPAQAKALDDALQTTWEKYRTYEVVQRSEPMGAQGRRSATIGRLTAEKYGELENHFWTALDPKLTEWQQRLARSKLRLASHTQGPQGYSISVDPGLLAWGAAGARIEVWQVGQWYHWRLETPIQGHELPEHVRSFAHEAKGPELPGYLRRLFPGTESKERPPAENADGDSQSGSR